MEIREPAPGMENRCWLLVPLIIESKGKDIGKLDGIAVSQ
jgi:hypothetical protein